MPIGKSQLGLPNPEGVATQWKGAFATSINWANAK
jgi:hypothetical protein